MENRELSCTVGWNVNCYHHCGERFLNKLNVELPYDQVISLLGICPEKSIIQKDTCTPMFIAALFVTVRTWKQQRNG